MPELVYLYRNEFTMSHAFQKILLLSVGYGKGHHSAAHALAEYYEGLGWETRVLDVCELAQPLLFRLTQQFYDFCVRKAPWLWGITYGLTDTADWSRLIHSPFLRPVVRCLQAVLERERPGLVVCTYPLFAYMLDDLRQRQRWRGRYVVVVTDAREISRPWMRSSADLVTVPDEGSRRLVLERYGLPESMIEAAGFPVRGAFGPADQLIPPAQERLRILYGAYRQTGGVIRDIEALMSSFPGLELTVLAGHRTRLLQRRFAAYCASRRLTVIRETAEMPELLRKSHFYIGKAGAATMFECYASCVPVLVNFTLPGQEQGNLELLLEDGAGYHVESTLHLVDTLRCLLEHEAEGWQLLRRAMVAAGRAGGAARIAAAIERRIGR